MGTPLKGGSSYKDEEYLIKWPHSPRLLPKRRHSIHRVGVEQGESSRGAVGHLLRQHEGAWWPALTPAVWDTRALPLSGEHEARGEPPVVGPEGEPGGSVLMFQSAFKKFIVLIPKALWELFLFALYYFVGRESRIL